MPCRRPTRTAPVQRWPPGWHARDQDELQPFRLQRVLASRLAGIAPPGDGTSNALDDVGRLAAETRGAAVAVDGRIIDRPVVLRARAILCDAYQ